MRVKKILSIFALFLVLIGFSEVAYARNSVDSIIFIAKNQSGISRICSTANNSVDVGDILVYTPSDGLVSFSNSRYKELSMADRNIFMETALYSVKESSMGSQVKNKLYNFIADQDSTVSAAVKLLRTDASADFVQAAAWFKPFGSFGGVILGLLSLFIFMFIGLSILLDVFYLAIPMFRMFVEAFSDKVSNDNSKKPKIISREAYTASLECEKGDTYQSSVSLYLRRRIPVLIMICIAVGYLISGQIYDLVVYFIDSFTWAIDW